jgi:hypothetical protein
MRKLLTTRRRVVIAGASAAVIIAGGAGTAFAYFTSSGSGNGYAQVGSAAQWQISGGTGSTTLYPGVTDDLTFTVTNTSSTQATNLGQVTAAIPTYNNAGTDVLKNDGSGHWVDASSCLATWFQLGTLAIAGGANQSIAPSGSTTVTVPVTLQSENVNQDACQGIIGPEVSLQVNEGDATPTSTST